MTELRSGPTEGDEGLRLAKIQPDLDTRRLFAHLMKDAEYGNIVGALVIAFDAPSGGKAGGYSLHLAGRAAGNLTYCAGALSVCEFALRRKIAAESPCRTAP